MIFIFNRSKDAYYNMAVEEFFLDRYDGDVFLLWQNQNTIVVGKNQNTLAEIDPNFVKEAGITVVRRLTGGGAMYQDPGNLNFTFITELSLIHICRAGAECLCVRGQNSRIPWVWKRAYQ